jgi:hypothetical protein
VVCNACRAERPDAARCFGSSAAAEVPTHHVQCEACGGDGCDACLEGRVLRYDCPWRLHDGGVEQLLAMWVMLRDHGVLPDPGGYLDQSHWTMDAFRRISAGFREHEAAA